MLRRAAALVFLLASGSPLLASAQGLAIPPGREPVILEAVQEAFTESPAAAIRVEGALIRVDTGQGAVLVAQRDPAMRVSVVCEVECDAETTARWEPVAARLKESLERRADAVWVEPVLSTRTRPATVRAPPVLGLRARQRLSWALLALALASVFVAPGARAPVSRASAVIAIAVVLAFFAAALALSPRPLHDHLCYLERTRCAASLACDTSHQAWGRPTFHVFGLLLQLVPHRLPWILGLGIALSSIALGLVFDVTARVARRAGLQGWAGAAGLLAVLFAALHPGFVRLAGAGSFWPVTLVLAFLALHLVLRAGEGQGWRRTAALAGAACAFALALGGSRLMLTLTPLLVLAPYAWLHGRAHPLHAVLALPPLAIVGVALADVFDRDPYGSAQRLGVVELFVALSDVATGSALAWSFTTPLALPVAIVALASRDRWRATLPLAYALVAIATITVLFTGPLEWRQYPDGYLKHFPQLALLAPLFGLGCVVIARLLAARVGRAALLAPVAAVLVVLTAWTRPEATRLLFVHRVMEREVAALERTFDALPPHELLVVADRLAQPEGLEVSGDPLEMHFPQGPYRAALLERGAVPADVVPLDAVLSGEVAIERPALLYVGSILQTFYRSEIEAGRVPESLERPELARLRERFELEPAHLFTVSTAQPRAVRDRVTADRQPEVELGFYWLRPRERLPR